LKDLRTREKAETDAGKGFVSARGEGFDEDQKNLRGERLSRITAAEPGEEFFIAERARF